MMGVLMSRMSQIVTDIRGLALEGTGGIGVLQAQGNRRISAFLTGTCHGITAVTDRDVGRVHILDCFGLSATRRSARPLGASTTSVQTLFPDVPLLRNVKRIDVSRVFLLRLIERTDDKAAGGQIGL